MRVTSLKSDIMLLSNWISGLNHCSKILAVSRFQSYYPQTCQTQCCKVLSSETQVHSICLKNFFSKGALWLQDKTQVPARVQTLHSTHSAFSFCSISHYSPCGSLCSNNPKPQRISFPQILCICLSCSYPRTICDFPPSSSLLSFKAQLRHRCILKSFLTLLDLLAAKTVCTSLLPVFVMA